MDTSFTKRLQALQVAYKELIERQNKQLRLGNGIYERYESCTYGTAYTFILAV
jgi:hypothetical protein